MPFTTVFFLQKITYLIVIQSVKTVKWIPEPDELSRQLLDKPKVVLPTKETTVSTKKKLTKHRK